MNDTIEGLLLPAKHLLKDAHIDTAALDAELLLCEVLRVTREWLLLYPNQLVTGLQKKSYHALLMRRLAKEPVAYILRKKEFYGHDFIVDRSVLIPRPDTEVLIDAVLKYIKLCGERQEIRSIADFGTGSGCLLLTVLLEVPYAHGIGIDKSSAAIQVAQRNAEKLGLAKRAKFRITDWRSLVGGGEFDIILSNPPYIKSNDISGLEAGVSLYEPHEALDGGEDGLVCYRQLAGHFFQCVKRGGMVFLECGLGQHHNVATIFEQSGFEWVGFEQDLAGIHRCVIMKRSKKDGSYET